jgi:hypothetical protein
VRVEGEQEREAKERQQVTSPLVERDITGYEPFD